MRMRRKNNLEERAKECAPYLLELGGDDLDARKPDGEAIITAEAHLRMEVGCGKGKFALEYAKTHENVRFFAVEQITNVIIVGAEKAKKARLDNLTFLRTGCEYLKRYFKQGSFDKIFLNFPCPFHKEAYRERRLTSKTFLDVYDYLLCDEGEIRLKTDDRRMFEYSIESISAYGYVIENVTLDLHSSKYAEGDIITEYESKFMQQGLPIFCLTARKRRN